MYFCPTFLYGIWIIKSSRELVSVWCNSNNYMLTTGEKHIEKLWWGKIVLTQSKIHNHFFSLPPTINPHKSHVLHTVPWLYRLIEFFFDKTKKKRFFFIFIHCVFCKPISAGKKNETLKNEKLLFRERKRKIITKISSQTRIRSLSAFILFYFCFGSKQSLLFPYFTHSFFWRRKELTQANQKVIKWEKKLIWWKKLNLFSCRSVFHQIILRKHKNLRVPMCA